MSRIQNAMALVLLIATAACGGGSEAAEALDSEEIQGDNSSSAPVGEGSTSSTPSSAEVPAIPAGTNLIFEVTETLSTEGAKSGDSFGLRLVSTSTSAGGNDLPAGTLARGVVRSASSSNDSNTPAELVVALGSLQVGGEWIPVESTVVQAQIDSDSGDSGARSAAKVGTGTAAGAIIGQILGGDTRSTVTGAVVGTVAGGAVAAATRSGHAVLPQGSTLTVRLDESVLLK